MQWEDIFRMQTPDYRTTKSLYMERPSLINIHEAVDRYQHPNKYLRIGYRPYGLKSSYSGHRRPYTRKYRRSYYSGKYFYKKKWY